MPDAPELSEVKRALFEKYLRGEVPHATTTASTIPQRSQESPAPSSHTDSRAPVVAVQTGGSKRPFFYLHVHWQGGAFYSFTLAHHLGADQPFYVLEPYKYDGLQILPTLETMATAYIDSIQVIQPKGPYLLGGFCGGGLIAFEIAQQLRAAGQAVDLLVLIEPKAGPDFFKMINARLVGGFIRSIGKLLRRSQDKQLEWFLRLRHVYRFLRYPQYRNEEGILVAPTAEALRKDWIGLFVWMISHYRPRPYPGKMTYFWAKDEPGSSRAGWGRVAAQEVEVRFIPGDATTCRNEHLHELAEHLSVYLNKPQASH